MSKFDPQRLVGAWQLARWFITYEDGSITEPLGPDAEGLLVYTADGWMSASIMAAGRARLSRGNPRAAPVAERAAAFDTFFGYCCRWRVVGQAVEHRVTISHNPALVGTVQVRNIDMKGRLLTLSANEPVPEGMRIHRLRWRPAKATPRKIAATPATANAGRKSATRSTRGSRQA